MADLDLDERELAAGAAVAMDMAREDRRDQKKERASGVSSRSAALTVGFVVLLSVGMLIVMLAFSG